MKFDFPKKIRSGYLVVFLLLSLCYFLSLSSFIQLRKQNRWVGHTREVINKMGQLNTEMKDAEVKWEEYLINRERTYLQAYQESRILVDSIYHLLSVSVGDNPVQEKRLEDMHAVIEHRYQVLDEELGILSRNSFKVSDSILAKEKMNMVLIDSIDHIVDSVTNTENRLLAERTQKVMFYSKVVFWIIIGAGLISGLLIIYSLVTFNMENKAKQQAKIQAETYHDQLEKRVKELASANRELMELRSLKIYQHGKGRPGDCP